MSAGDSRILLGLGATEPVGRLTVKWSWGETQTWENLEPNRYYELQEGQAAPAAPMTDSRKKAPLVD